MLGVSVGVAAEQFCYSSVPETAAEDQFKKIDGGIAWHTVTNLMWMRCAIGQTWDGSDCLGEAQTYTWKEALQLSVGYEFLGSKNWRLPNLKELNSITEQACVRPSVDENVFSNTPSDDFWTSTPSGLDPTRAWVVAFFNSSTSIKQKDRSIYVRLVRTSLPEERDE